MYENGHIQPRKAYAVGHPALVAKVGEGHQDAIDLWLVGFEQCGTLFGVPIGLHRAIGSILGGKDDGLKILLL